MAKLSFGAYPHMLGFEQLEQLLERAAKSSNDGYPPFNIEQTSDRSFRISLAVAGFSEETYLSFWKIVSLLYKVRKIKKLAQKFFFIVELQQGNFKDLLFLRMVLKLGRH